jgi:nitric oxide reductase large subunit
MFGGTENAILGIGAFVLLLATVAMLGWLGNKFLEHIKDSTPPGTVDVSALKELLDSWKA